jgi:nitric oxide reductase activation protein
MAEHRAESPDEMEVIVLKDFHGHPMQKTNLMRHQCHGVNRDGLALLWAESRLNSLHIAPDRKLVILVSDGLPNHEHAGIPYNGESARRDVHGIVHRMHRSGTDVIAIALDDGSKELSSNLRKMFDNVVSCHDVSELPRRLVGLLSKVIANHAR